MELFRAELDVFLSAVNERIGFVPFPFSSTNFQRWLPSPPILMRVAFVAHDLRRTVGIASRNWSNSSTRKPFGVLEYTPERLSGVFPGRRRPVDSAHGLRADFGKSVVEEEMNQVNSVGSSTDRQCRSKSRGRCGTRNTFADRTDDPAWSGAHFRQSVSSSRICFTSGRPLQRGP